MARDEEADVAGYVKYTSVELFLRGVTVSSRSCFTSAGDIVAAIKRKSIGWSKLPVLPKDKISN
ncbi:hypothetical protein MTR_6g087280 [Medicago truncatula]|uniref:Uncharacterized protein n=1 Tax=Medicago truncatula TaxID=3880 RepID=G7KPG7_MEDTR|nr:hypothetical protein MTR_6g087280 [Medicago truncatula]